MEDNMIINLNFKNGNINNQICIYESGLVKINKDIKHIDIVEYIVKYLESQIEQGYQKSKFDDVCKIEYKGKKYNSGILYSNIELMVRNNKVIDDIDKQNNRIRNEQKLNQEKNKLRNETIIKNKSKIINMYENRIQLDIEALKDNSKKEFESIVFNLKEKDKFDLGESRVLSKFIDVPNDLEYPQELEFLAQINLKDVSKYDKSGLLPKRGNLYFFHGPLIDNKLYEFGKVIYSDNENLVRKEVFIYDDFMIREFGLENFLNKKDTYTYENEKENKIFGMYANPQFNETDIIKVSNEYIVLFQLGEDLYGEGVTSFLIKEKDLINKNFNNIIYTYSQT